MAEHYNPTLSRRTLIGIDSDGPQGYCDHQVSFCMQCKSYILEAVTSESTASVCPVCESSSPAVVLAAIDGLDLQKPLPWVLGEERAELASCAEDRMEIAQNEYLASIDVEPIRVVVDPLFSDFGYGEYHCSYCGSSLNRGMKREHVVQSGCPGGYRALVWTIGLNALHLEARYIPLGVSRVALEEAFRAATAPLFPEARTRHWEFSQRSACTLRLPDPMATANPLMTKGTQTMKPAENTPQRKENPHNADEPTWGDLFGLAVAGVFLVIAGLSALFIVVLAVLSGKHWIALLVGLGYLVSLYPLYWPELRSWWSAK